VWFNSTVVTVKTLLHKDEGAPQGARVLKFFERLEKQNSNSSDDEVHHTGKPLM